MVIGGLANVTNGIGEHERDRPAAGGVFSPQPAVFQVPFIQPQLFELGLDFIFGVSLFFFVSHVDRLLCCKRPSIMIVLLVGWSVSFWTSRRIYSRTSWSVERH